MNIIYVAIVILPAIIILLVVIYWIKIRNAKRMEAFASEFLKEVDGVDSPLAHNSAIYCCGTVKKIINTVNVADKIQICRLHRLLNSEVKTFKRYIRNVAQYEEKKNDDIVNLWDATLSLAESARILTVHPEFINQKHELKELSTLKQLIKWNECSTLSVINDKAGLNKENVSLLINTFTGRVPPNKFEEESTYHNFFVFLIKLNYFVISLEKLIEEHHDAE